MNCLTTTAVILLASMYGTPSFATTLYKYTDKDGNVYYSDQKPAGTPAEVIKVPELQTYTAPPKKTPKKAVQSKKASPAVVKYQKIAITSPSNEQSFQNQATIAVQLALEPDLAKGHTLQVFIDGKAAGQASDKTTWELQGVERGEHTLHASVYSARGKEIKTSPSITFYMHRHSALKQSGTSPPRSPIPPQSQ